MREARFMRETRFRLAMGSFHEDAAVVEPEAAVRAGVDDVIGFLGDTSATSLAFW